MSLKHLFITDKQQLTLNSNLVTSHYSKIVLLNLPSNIQRFVKYFNKMKHTYKYLILFLLGAPLAQAQSFDKASTYSKFIDTKDLAKHLNVLASDEYEGRETGKEGQRKASEYLKNEFQKLGLVPASAAGYKQEYKLKEKVLANRKFSINQRDMQIGDEFMVSKDRLEYSVLSNEIVFVGYGINEGPYNSFKGIDVTNKVIVVIDGEPKVNDQYIINADGSRSKWSDRKYKIEALRKLNPSLIIYIDNNYEKYKSYYKHQLESSTLTLAFKTKNATNVPLVNAGQIIAEELLKANKKIYNKVLESLSKRKTASKPLLLKSTIKLDVNFIEQDVNSDNVLAMVPGSDLQDEYLFITAHYDHIGIIDGKVYNGADDDGSGTVALLEIAQAFMEAKKAGNGPRRNIVFMAVSGEEKGLLGSEYYVNFPVIPLSKTIVDLNIDMIGRFDEAHKEDTNFVYVIGADKLSSELHTINEKAGEFLGIKLDYKFNDPKDPNKFYYRSDHYNFAKNNIPIAFYFNGVHEDYHKEGDEVNKIGFPMLAKRAQLVFYTAWELANRDARIVVDKQNDFTDTK